jgi:hypothetical protein
MASKLVTFGRRIVPAQDRILLGVKAKDSLGVMLGPPRTKATRPTVGSVVSSSDVCERTWNLSLANKINSGK